MKLWCNNTVNCTVICSLVLVYSTNEMQYRLQVTQKLSYTQSELFASTLPEIQDTDNIMSLSDPDRSQFVDLSGDNISSKLSLILCLCILHGRVTLRPSIHKLLSRTDRQSAMHNVAPKQESHITNEKHLLPIIPN